MARLLELVGQSGIPLIIRSLNTPNIAVKARAIAQIPGVNQTGFKVSNISERGLEHLSRTSDGSFQIEFILRSEKVQFYSRLLIMGRQGGVFAIPSYLESLERRRNTRYGVGESLLAFMSFENLKVDPKDLSTQPIFESTKELGSLVPVSDISSGGVGLHFRFPSICTVMEAKRPIEQAFLWLPMMSPFAVDVSVRWHRRIKDQIQVEDGKIRKIRLFKFGIQFLNLAENQSQSIQMFIQRLSQADAI